MIPLLSTHSAPTCGGKVVAPATKGGMHFLERSEVGLFSDARQGGIKIGAESAAPRQRSDTI